MLAELTPKPDQVTVTVNTAQMNIFEQMEPADYAGTSLAEPAMFKAFREMIVPGGPAWAEEHVKRLTAKGIQSAFQFYNINSFETVERMIRRGIYKGPLVMNWVAIGGGMDAPNIYNLANFLRATPDGAMITLESSMLNVLPINMMAIAMGLHVRCGIEDNLWTQDRKSKMSTVKQIEQLVRISREVGREVATGKEAKKILQDRHVLQQHRRDAGEERLRAEPQDHVCFAAGGRVTMSAREATVLIVPGLRDHVSQHWQTLLASRLPRVRTVVPMGRSNLDCRERVVAIEEAAASIDGPIILVAHSGGVMATLHWARQTRRQLRGALLATPADFDQPMPEGYPSIGGL